MYSEVDGHPVHSKAKGLLPVRQCLSLPVREKKDVCHNRLLGPTWRFPMKFEHFALNVPDARAMSRWYVESVGLQVLRGMEVAPYTHFLADETGRVFIELYSNPLAAMPDYAAQHPLVLHFAVVSADAGADRERLEKAGAIFFKEDSASDGTRLIMMRDPWGVPLQLCQRSTPFTGL